MNVSKNSEILRANYGDFYYRKDIIEWFDVLEQIFKLNDKINLFKVILSDIGMK